MISLKEIEETMSVFIRHQTHPLAVKMLRPGDVVPEGAKNPVRDFGVPFSLCQAFTTPLAITSVRAKAPQKLMTRLFTPGLDSTRSSAISDLV